MTEVYGTYSLFLDDERFPPKDDRNWKIARNYADFFRIIQDHGMPIYISFDHDLGAVDGKELNGHDCARDLINDLVDHRYKLPDGFSFTVHSMNSVGKKNIEATMNFGLNHI